LFAGLFVAGYWASLYLPILSEWTNEGLVLRILSEVSAGRYEEVSTPAFAYALACTIVATAGGLAVAFLISDVIVVRLALLAKRPILKTKSRAEFNRAGPSGNQLSPNHRRSDEQHKAGMAGCTLSSDRSGSFGGGDRLGRRNVALDRAAVRFDRGN
jgi:hypothetical protein